MADDLAVVIVSVHHPSRIGYLKKTVESMRVMDGAGGACRILVSMGSAEPPPPGVEAEISHIGEEQISPFARSHGVYKLTLNFLRAMELGIGTGAGTVVVAEDDLQMARNWLRRVQSLSALAGQTHTSWMMSACTSHAESEFARYQQPSYWGDAIARFRNPAVYWGNQCMVYPRSTLIEMSDHLSRCIAAWKENSVAPESRGGMIQEDFCRIGDQAIKSFFVQQGVPLLASIPSLAKHVGKYNSWQAPGAVSHAWKNPTARFEGT